jgi:signal transduction histidine kinase
MEPSQPTQLLEGLESRSDALATAWLQAIAGTGSTPLEPEETRARLVALAQQFIHLLLAEPFRPRAVGAIGASLADLSCPQPEALGQTLELLPPALLRDLPPEHASALQPRLSASLGGLAAGFCERVEDQLRQAQADTHRSNRLLLALGQAAEAVQRAATPEEIYHTVGDEVEGAGYHAAVFALDEDKTHLRVSYVTWQPSALETAEQLLGFSQREVRIPLAPDGFFQPVITGGESVFCERTVDLAMRGLPTLGRALLGRLFGMLGMEQSIYAPLVTEGETWGVLCIVGTDLTAADVPAVTVFASQASIALENARLLAELSASHEQLRQLAQQVIDAQEMERRRLSTALHDEAGQALTALGISLELISEDLPPEYDSLRRRLSDAVALTISTMDRLRKLAQDLRPPNLDVVGLDMTLEDACRDFARLTGLAIDYRGTGELALAEEVSICLYRFLQEALTNVARHAGADCVQVALDRDAETVSLAVEDDGQGFEPHAAPSALGPSPGIGLLGMQERLESLGGRLEIDSQPGRGTRLVAHVPLEKAGS